MRPMRRHHGAVHATALSRSAAHTTSVQTHRHNAPIPSVQHRFHRRSFDRTEKRGPIHDGNAAGAQAHRSRNRTSSPTSQPASTSANHPLATGAQCVRPLRSLIISGCKSSSCQPISQRPSSKQRRTAHGCVLNSHATDWQTRRMPRVSARTVQRTNEPPQPPTETSCIARPATRRGRAWRSPTHPLVAAEVNASVFGTRLASATAETTATVLRLIGAVSRLAAKFDLVISRFFLVLGQPCVHCAHLSAADSSRC